MRLFVGLELPDLVRARLAALYGSLPGARWTPPENLHLTLRFVGETRSDMAEEIDHALSAIRVRGFPLTLSGTGIFERVGISERGGRKGALLRALPRTLPRTLPGTLWAGIERNERLEHLQGKVETALQRIGLPAERKRFQPHVSLARIDGVAEPVLASWVQAHNLLRSESVPITHFTLFRSLLGKEQPVYIAEVEYELV